MEISTNWADTLKQTYIARGLQAEEICELAKLAHTKNFTSGENIITCGDPPTALYVVLAGRVELVTADEDKLMDVGPGNVLGEVGVLSDLPSDIHAVCAGFTKAAEIPIHPLRELLAHNRHLGFMVLANIAAVLCQRLHAASVVMHHLHEHDAWDGSY